MKEVLNLWITEYLNILLKGKCAITGKFLEYEEIHCHHIVPVKQQGTDKYSNLIIIHKNVHALVHAIEEKSYTNT